MVPPYYDYYIIIIIVIIIIFITRNVLLSAQMGERASVVLICITQL